MQDTLNFEPPPEHLTLEKWCVVAVRKRFQIRHFQHAILCDEFDELYDALQALIRDHHESLYILDIRRNKGTFNGRDWF